MAFATLRYSVQKMVQTATYTNLLKRRMSYKSAIALDTLYPNSSLKLSTPAFTAADPNEKFNGYIPVNKLEITYSASSGPGGQNVNKVHTKVDVRFKPSEADWLQPEVKAKLLAIHNNKLTKDGYLIIRSDVTRSQTLNLADCMQKLRNIIRDASITKREPSPDTFERIRQRHLKAARMRVSVKREESLKRALRQPPRDIDL